MVRTKKSNKGKAGEMSTRPVRQTKSVYKTRTANDSAQREPATNVGSGTMVNADSPRDRGAARQVDRVSVESPRGPGPVVGASDRMPANENVHPGSSVTPQGGSANVQGLMAMDSRMQQMIHDTVERILTEAKNANNQGEAGISYAANSQQKANKGAGVPVEHVSSESGIEEETERLNSKHKNINKRKRKQKNSNRQRKVVKAKERYQDSDTSDGDSDEGKSDHSKDDYDTEEDQELALLRESFGMLIGENLPAKQREKILTGKFVEMAALLPQNYTKESDTVYRITKRGIRPAKQRLSRFLSLEQWNQAFGVYKSVMIENAETLIEAKTLVKQLETYHRDINTMANQGSQWRDYDRVFRSDMAEKRSGVTFGTLRHDIMLNVAHNYTPVQNETRRFRARRDRQAVPRNRGSFRNDTSFRSDNSFRSDSRKQGNECFKFNSQRGCPFPECRFRHSCSKCGGTHPAVRCFKAGKQYKSQQNRSQAQGAQNTARSTD